MTLEGRAELMFQGWGGREGWRKGEMEEEIDPNAFYKIQTLSNHQKH